MLQRFVYPALASVLLVSLVASCGPDTRAEARPKGQGPRRRTPSPPRGPELYYGERRACPRQLEGLVNREEIRRACGLEETPVGLAGGTWCRWKYAEGNLVLMWAPSYLALKERFVEASPFLLAGRPAFSWRAEGGVSSIVGSLTDGSALVVQAPKGLCRPEGLTQLAAQALRRARARKFY